ncbi:peptidylprolyl isomerase [Salibacterium salarium]|uniref:peptidylprolyl isomerase n=1 Tax=Salibacterium salarium TaxID=284579 RepID=A0A3R9QL94_9BACI|nr:SurA N-terminal domain-containing protein [Salibacterium salarium]RSL33288.1 peptidylprolyl isomerase [Salibacterium salarium]
MSKKWILSLALAVSVSVMAACGGEQGSGDQENNEEQSQEQSNEENEGNSSEDGGDEGNEGNQGETAQESQTPDPDLSDIPEVVAEVNGEEIAKSEFESVYVQTLSTYASQGMNLEEQDQSGEMKKQLQQQTVNQLIGQKLLIQEANNQDISASEDEINEEMTSLKEQFGSDEQYQTALESEGISEEQLQSDIEQQVKVDKLVESETGEVEVTDEEVEEMYNQMVDAQGGGESSEEGSSEGEGEGESSESPETETPSLEEMRPQIEQQITTQKESQQVQSLVDELRESGDVTVNI